MQLSLERSVFFAQEFDHVPLFPFEPSEQRRNKEMQRNHGASLCQCLVDAVLRHYGFDRMTDAYGALWWVPLDHRPTIAEGSSEWNI